jgi:hypothetical protein
MLARLVLGTGSLVGGGGGVRRQGQGLWRAAARGWGWRQVQRGREEGVKGRDGEVDVDIESTIISSSSSP